MMSLWDALRMNMMISYQELVRTFLSFLVILHYYGFTLFGKLIGSQLNKVCLYTIININI
ncbi:hypothetical protein EE070_21820 [Klebsiella pneumoniae]|nr:hypothetical protein [Klebsiella pneumoniae]NAV31731.1 hypothetical protein [Klebsiella pneumoniae]